MSNTCVRHRHRLFRFTALSFLTGPAILQVHERSVRVNLRLNAEIFIANCRENCLGEALSLHSRSVENSLNSFVVNVNGPSNNLLESILRGKTFLFESIIYSVIRLMLLIRIQSHSIIQQTDEIISVRSHYSHKSSINCAIARYIYVVMYIFFFFKFILGFLTIFIRININSF